MEFQKFDKIPRLSRDCIITEKIDGTNCQIFIINKNTFDQFHENCAYDSIEAFLEKHCLYNPPESPGVEDLNKLYVFAGSRKRWLDTSSGGDNFGFAKWVQANTEELLKLGEGRHYGEWYGKGIQRNYGLAEKQFALFNVGKWASHDKPIEVKKKQVYPPKCCGVVPILWQGEFETNPIECTLESLHLHGSQLVPGFMEPEGIIIYHTASGQLFKKTILGDEKPKNA